jgi:hypothetical protein
VRFDLWLNVDEEEDRRRLTENGWSFRSPLKQSLEVFGYQELFRQSRAEWTVAKDQNVRLRSGWFSERDACYLASGKPVIAQSTGFENMLPTGAGLFAFRTMDDVLGAIDTIESDYPKAARAARAVAEDYLDSRKVCAKFVKDIGL